MTEEEVIVNGLIKIKEGVLNQDWNAVCEGYAEITGEDLKPKESKLAKIRRLTAEKQAQKPVKQKVSKETKAKSDIVIAQPEDVVALTEENEPVIDPNEVVVKQVGKLKFITTKADPKEKAKNEQIAAKQDVMPVERRGIQLVDTSNLPDNATVRANPNPTIPDHIRKKT